MCEKVEAVGAGPGMRVTLSTSLDVLIGPQVTSLCCVSELLSRYGERPHHFGAYAGPLNVRTCEAAAIDSGGSLLGLWKDAPKLVPPSSWG